METENPFKYGTVVTGRDFVDREQEIDEIVKDLRAGKSIMLYSKRRMGKTSLLLETARRFEKEFCFVYVDLYGVTNRSRFLEILVREVVRSSYGKAGRFAATIKELMKGTKLRLVLTPDGDVGVEFPRAEPEPEEVSDVFDLAEKAAKRKNRRVVVMFDEFQEVSSFDGVALLKTMRSRFQLQRKVAYIFSGSKRHLLHQVFDEKEGAFFKFARPMELGPIPIESFEKFIVDKFTSAGGRLDRADARRIVEVSIGYPYYAQQISHELYDLSTEPEPTKDVEKAIVMATEHQSPAYSYLWDSIKSPLQRKYLLAVAKEPKVPHGLDFIERHGLRSHSHLQRIKTQLEARGIIESGEIDDPLLVLWLRNMKK